MGGFQPTPIDPLPTVQAPQQQENVGKPAQAPEAQPVSGWMGATKKGQALNIFSNFLQGWMAGKHMQEQKKLDAALKNVGNFETDYKNSMTIYQNLLNSPDATPEQKEKARQDVLTNWHELHEQQKKYLIPDPTTQKKQGVGGKIKSKLKGAFTAQDPHLFASGAIDLADKMDPTQSLSKDPRQEAANAKAAEDKKRSDLMVERSSILKKLYDEDKTLSAEKEKACG